MKPEARIQRALFFQYNATSSCLVPNIYYPYYEMDLLRITKSGYLHEYEIKSSKADFRNEFRAGAGRCKKNKHALMERTRSGTGTPSKCPNYYWFACPTGIIKPEDIEGRPYGLLYVSPQNIVSKIVNAVKLHSVKVETKLYQKLARNLSIKLFYHSKKFND